MRCSASRLRTWVTLLGVLLPLSLASTAFSADKHNKPKPNPSDSVGMYSNYVDDSRVVFDKYLGDTGPQTEAQLLPALLSALDQLSKYPPPATLPEIYRVPHERLQEMACTAPCGVLATYRPGEGIYLAEQLKPETNLFDRSVLLHELVHYLQDLNNEFGDAKPCERWYHREIEAYAIQKTFLTLVGSPVRVGYSAHRSTCDDEQQAVKSTPH